MDMSKKESLVMGEVYDQINPVFQMRRIADALEHQNKLISHQNTLLQKQNEFHAARNKTLNERSLPPIGDKK